jgi:hypothetical protein
VSDTLLQRDEVLGDDLGIAAEWMWSRALRIQAYHASRKHQRIQEYPE